MARQQERRCAPRIGERPQGVAQNVPHETVLRVRCRWMVVAGILPWGLASLVPPGLPSLAARSPLAEQCSASRFARPGLTHQ